MTRFTLSLIVGFTVMLGYMGWILGAQHVQNQAVDRNFAHFRVYRSLGSPQATFEWNINTNH